MQSVQEPLNLEDVANLVLELYRPGPPEKIQKIQETLHTLQKSPQGWQLADALLQSTDETVQFFGALTYTIKINTDSVSLSPEDAGNLLAQLLNWVCICVERSSTARVLRKLCSTLVTYFLRFPSSWSNCMRHLILCLCVGKFVPLETMAELAETTLLVGQLSYEKLSVVMWFGEILAEEVGKTDGNNIKHHKFHDILQGNADDVVPVLSVGLGVSRDKSSVPDRIRQDTMKCFQSWVLYSHRALVDANVVLAPLKTLTKPAIACLVDEVMFESTAELFIDVLGNYSKFLTDADYNLLFELFNSEWSNGLYQRLIGGDNDFEVVQYGQLMLAFGDAKAEDLAKNLDAPYQNYVNALLGLLAVNGYVTQEDQIFQSAVEFWATFVEILIDSLYSDEDFEGASPPSTDAQASGPAAPQSKGVAKPQDKPWFQAAKAHVLKAIELCWRKIQYPPPEVLETFDSDDRASFNDQRLEVLDLVQAAYTFTGNHLLTMFANLALQSLQQQAWFELEASLTCLGGLADCVAEDETTTAILSNLFDSVLFTTLADPASQAPDRTKQSALALIGQYDEFFRSNVQYLPDALRFLFSSLGNNLLATIASKSVLSLCASCRQTLVAEVEAFLQQFEQMLQSGTTDGIVKERVSEAIGSVIQALPDDNSKTLPLMRLLQAIEGDYQRGLATGAELETSGVDMLRCIASIARGLQAPNDAPVDLDAPNDAVSGAFWTNGPGVEVQHRVQSIIGVLTRQCPTSGEMIDAACKIFRAGFAERTAGPFVFSPSLTKEFLSAYGPSTPRLDVLISTASSFVSGNSGNKSDEFRDALSNLTSWILQILQAIGEPANDPEIAQAGLDFLSRLLPQHCEHVFQRDATFLEFTIMFSIKSLRGRDPLPKFAAIDFWNALIPMATTTGPMQADMQALLSQVGTLLARALIYNISGHAARSELDKLCEPMRKLVVADKAARTWFETALFSEDFTSERIGDVEKRAFLSKIISGRGGRSSNQFIKNLWLECRGTSFAYVS